MPVTTDDVLTVIRRYAEVIAENRTYLIELDSPIGDADHGENMDRGMRAVVAKLDAPPTPGDVPSTPGDALKLVATTLISSVGGAAGPLYGTAFLRASTAVQGKETLTGEDVLAALQAARDGIAARGKAGLEDKTMLDAWIPAVAALEASGSSDLAAGLAKAADAAEEGMRATTPLIARKGRASYLGDRSAGHQDPGATSSALLFRVMADTASPAAS